MVKISIILSLTSIIVQVNIIQFILSKARFYEAKNTETFTFSHCYPTRFAFIFLYSCSLRSLCYRKLQIIHWWDFVIFISFYDFFGNFTFVVFFCFDNFINCVFCKRKKEYLFILHYPFCILCYFFNIDYFFYNKFWIYFFWNEVLINKIKRNRKWKIVFMELEEQFVHRIQ